MTDFVNFSVRSNYSILQALSSPKELFLRAKELDQKTIAITDYGTCASFWEGYRLGKEFGVKFIPGCDFSFADDNQNKSDKLRHIILLAKNAQGYKNLLMLHRAGFDNSATILKKVIPVIDWKLLEQYKEGLLCLTGCGNGIIGQLINSKSLEVAETTLKRLIELFGDNLGAEIQAHNQISNATTHRGAVNQIFTNAQIIKLAKKYDVRIIPTSFSHYTHKGEHELNDVLQAIGSMQPIYSNNRLKFTTQDLYLKSGDEIKAFFARNYGEEFATEICRNTVEFAEKCENPDWVDPKFSNPSGKELPTFPVKDTEDYPKFKEWLLQQSENIQRLDEDKSYLKYKCELAFKTKVPPGKENEYRKRIEEELDTFYYCGVSSYLLITADFIDWAHRNNVSVGFSRGSAGGSLVCYFLNIHKIDSIKYNLYFERFFSKLRTEIADIDTDLSQAGRQKVIDYLIGKYGRENVAQITNVNTITPKVYIKDLARTLQLGGSREEAVKIGNNIADLISSDIHSIDDANTQSALFSENCKRNYPEFLKFKKICPSPRSNGIHAAGVIISSRPLCSIVPVRKDKDGALVVEFDKYRAEEAGLVKMDLLGVKTLDTVDLAIEIIQKQSKTVPTIDYDGYDQKTYDLISRGDTLCVFQLGESGGTIDLCRKIKPKSIDDIATINTLARPQARAIRKDYVLARNGKKEIKLLHPSLERAMRPFYGFSIYDESLLILAHDVAGWSLAEADQLRKLTKAKGKFPEKVKKARESFISDAIKRKVPESTAIKIWDNIVAPFGSYAFNAAHSVGYSYLGFKTAYLKAHFPIEFLLANLKFTLQNNAPNAEEKALEIKSELKRFGNKILPPNVNYSEISYTIKDDTTLITGFEAIKQVGDDAIDEIIAKRPFSSFDDFMLRIENKKVRANAIQALVAVGALDDFKLPRKLMFLYASDYRKKLQIWLKKHDPSIEKFSYQWPEVKEWSIPELYALEYKYLGEAFIADKRQAYGDFFSNPSTKAIPLKAIKKMTDRDFLHSIKGEIKSIFEFKIKKETSKWVGKEMLKCIIEDEFGEQINLTIFPETYNRAKSKLKQLVGNKHKLDVGLVLHFNGSVNVYEDETGIVMNELFNAAPPPQLPKDLKAQKISVKRASRKNSDTKKTDVEEIIENLEDDLFNQGFIDLDQEDGERDILQLRFK